MHLPKYADDSAKTRRRGAACYSGFGLAKNLPITITNMAPIAVAIVGVAGGDVAVNSVSKLSLIIRPPPSQPKRPAPGVMMTGNLSI